jgi:putative ABC transport system permease protein
MTKVHPRDIGLASPRFRTRDALRESWLSIAGHPGRSLLTAIGTVLGAAAFVVTVGLSATVSHQVADSFDTRRATEVIVRPGAKLLPADVNFAVPSWQGDAALARLRDLAGVAAVGKRIQLKNTQVSRNIDGSAAVPAPVVGVDPGALTVTDPHVVAGRTFDNFHESNGISVVMLSQGLATRLAIDRVGVAVFLGDRAYTVIGIFDDVFRRPETLLGAVVPFSVAQVMASASKGLPPERDVVIATVPGAAQLVGVQAPLALRPEQPTDLISVAPPDPKTLRQEVEGNVAQLSFAVSLIALIIGAVSIGNAATAAVAVRTSEIGLRRAVGARPVHIFSQLLGETTLLGGVGGVMGASLGLLGTVVVALIRHWQPILDLRAALLASAAGAVAGLVAGMLPAARAMRIPPVVALQR